MEKFEDSSQQDTGVFVGDTGLVDFQLVAVENARDLGGNLFKLLALFSHHHHARSLAVETTKAKNDHRAVAVMFDTQLLTQFG